MTDSHEAELLSGAVRFVTPYEEGDAPAVRLVISRIEGEHNCRLCNRSHPYTVGLANAGEERSSGNLGFDSWEDAAHQVRQWLPDGPWFLGRLEPERDEDESEELMFDNRTEAIKWLLEPV